MPAREVRESPDNWINVRQLGNPVPRIEAALAVDSQILPLAYVVAVAGYEALVAPSFIALEMVDYQHPRPGPESAHAERTLCMIGTLPSNTLVVSPRAGVISRHHAQISLRMSAAGGPVFLLADTSKNGTFVNGQRITTPQALSHDDYIGLAANAVVLQFLRHGETATAARLASSSYDALTR